MKFSSIWPVLFILLLFAGQAFSQKPEVKEASTKILDTRYPGYRVKITGPSGSVDAYVKKTLRSMSKMRERNTYYQMTDMNLNGRFYDERGFYAQVVTDSDVQSVWIGADTVLLGASLSGILLADLQQFAYDLAIGYYKSEAQKEIDETEKAEQFMVKQQSRLLRDSVSLQNQLSNNEKELIRLQEAIEANKKEHEDLLKKIADNSLEQDSTEISLSKIRRVLEMQRKKKDAIK